MLQSNATPALPAGTEVGRDQWLICSIPHITDLFPGGTIRDEGSRIILKTEDCFYAINRSTGDLEQIRLGSQQLLLSPLTPAFLRGKSDGVPSGSPLKLSDEWERVTLKHQLPKPSIAEVDHMSHSVTFHQNVGSGLLRTYRLNSDGSLELEMRLRTGKNPPKRIGFHCGLIPELNRFTWFGRGPWDCYPDRKDAGSFGQYSASVKEQDAFPIPQEYGNKTRTNFTEIKIAELGNDAGIIGAGLLGQ